MSEASKVDTKLENRAPLRIRDLIELPAPGGFESAFVFSGNKMGGTLLFYLIEGLCRQGEKPYFNFEESAFIRGLCPSDFDIGDLNDVFNQRGYYFIGFRGVASGYLNKDAVLGKKKILLVRDPRDVLTSRYFSISMSHVLPGGVPGYLLREQRQIAQSHEINQFVTEPEQIEFIKSEYEGLIGFIDDQTKIYRYEDVIYEKRRWCAEMADWLQIQLLPENTNYVANCYDVIPTEERPHEHIRQVHPGNYCKHLSKRTVAEIEMQFSFVFDRFGYQRDTT